ncbi:MAG: T9SS type A sorting domain-containing protein [Luteibaculaceae bacterium]
MRKVVTFICLLLSAQVFGQGLSGIFELGPNSQAFPNFASAVKALQLNGVGEGGVAFVVSPGIYNENIELSTVKGASAENRVIFIALDPMEKPILRSSGTNKKDDAIIKLKAASFITFDGFRLEEQNTIPGEEVEYGIALFGTPTEGNINNQFKNIEIFLGNENALPLHTTRGIYQKSVAQNNKIQATNSHNLFENLVIDNVATGIELRGHSTAQGSPIQFDENNIVRNVFLGVNKSLGHNVNFGSAHGILAHTQRNLAIEYCIVDSLRLIGSPPTMGGFLSAFSLENVSGSISGNRVNYIKSSPSTSKEPDSNTSLTPVGIRASVPSGMELFIHNNSIANLARENYSSPTNNAPIAMAGIWIHQQLGLNQGIARILHNSIFLDSPSPIPMSTAGIFVDGNAAENARVQINNNVIVNSINTKGPSYKSFAIADGNLSRAYLSSDFNVLQTDGVNGCIGGLGIGSGQNIEIAETLLEWQKISLGDFESSKAIVIFQDCSVGDLRILAELVDDLSVYYMPYNPNVPLDYFGEYRMLNKTSAGAFEMPLAQAEKINPFEAQRLFRAYPNPFVSTLNIELDLDTRNFTNLRILDMSGTVVYNNSMGSVPNGFYVKVLSLDYLQPGFYMVQVLGTHGNPIQSIKVMKQ